MRLHFHMASFLSRMECEVLEEEVQEEHVVLGWVDLCSYRGPSEPAELQAQRSQAP